METKYWILITIIVVLILVLYKKQENYTELSNSQLNAMYCYQGDSRCKK